MTNKLALILAILICLAALIDAVFYGSQHFIFLGKKLFQLLDWVAFWR
ncbi:hypothetical protein [Seohaeicola zhoushanensis]|uniref:Uncharacterized protein n=1 Tax=Seohaeicola zhoushanensis TaxID=1569283 RepID=A0A8J3M717_9RHOB|nr:hypothetical protein [Seohaeicola zhoushanensis]GHF50137.1 hypothetical protein GCM10017056_22270 [Seohaeicola zhoushanensis]